MDNNSTTESNYLFDNSLKMQNNLWGIRNLKEVSQEGKKMAFFKKILLLCRQIILQQFLGRLLINKN